MVLSMPLYAFADINQTVSAGFGEGQEQHVTVNDNVSVINEVNAVFVEAHAPGSAADKNASAEVKGDVTAESYDSFSAVYAEGRNGDATVKINGNLKATVTGSGNVNGVELWGRSYNGSGYAYANIGGSITATSNSAACGIDSDCGDAFVTGDVSASGSKATGVYSYCEGNVNIGGDLKAEGSANACGAFLCTSDEKQQTLTVNKDVIVKCTSDDPSSVADGVRFYANGGKAYADIKGSIITSSNAETAGGLRFISTGSDGDGCYTLSPTYFDVKVGNSIISDDYGIAKCNDSGTVDLLVENEVKAKNTAVLLKDNSSLYEQASDGSGYCVNQLNLTVWKLNLNDRGNVAELLVDDDEAVAAKAFEKKINYIIKVQQPTEGGTVSLVDSSGNALKKSNNYYVAHEGEKVVVKANLLSGYTVIAAYNGVGEMLPLLKDENGNFYIIVPKGGGIYISVDIEESSSYSSNEDIRKKPVPVVAAQKTAKKANPLKIKGKKVTLKASKLADKKQTISVKKAIKFVQKGKGTITYKKIKGNKKITVNKKTGKITVKKGLKKGTYKVKVQVTAAGNSNYKKAVKKTTVKIVVK
ncbi:MAG: hypothetical protein IJI47_00670, partial [Eubacterium sp.]|nr:hypothetical protein [Eubacterium sp.]